MIANLLGGVGLFLLGMSLMTDGLKAVAGETLRKVLGRFTGGPISALLSGAALTALVQLGGFAADTRSGKTSTEEDMKPLRDSFLEILQTSVAALRGEGQRLGAPKVERNFAQAVADQRKEVLQRTAEGDLPVEASLQRLEAIRWMDRIVHHAGRAVHYLAPT